MKNRIAKYLTLYLILFVSVAAVFPVELLVPNEEERQLLVEGEKKGESEEEKESKKKDKKELELEEWEKEYFSALKSFDLLQSRIRARMGHTEKLWEAPCLPIHCPPPEGLVA